MQNDATALTLEITRRLNEISVLCTPSGPLVNSALRTENHATLSWFIHAHYIPLKHIFFKGRKLVFLYLLRMGYFLPIYNSLEMLFRNLDDEVKNKSFVQPWSSWERKNEWRPHSKASRATSSFHESRRIALHHCREHLSMRQDGREKGMLKPGHSKFSLSISIKGLREICFIKRQMC